MENLSLMTYKNYVLNISRKLNCQLSEWFSVSINFLAFQCHLLDFDAKMDENRRESTQSFRTASKIGKNQWKMLRNIFRWNWQRSIKCAWLGTSCESSPSKTLTNSFDLYEDIMENQNIHQNIFETFHKRIAVESVRAGCTFHSVHSSKMWRLYTKVSKNCSAKFKSVLPKIYWESKKTTWNFRNCRRLPFAHFPNWLVAKVLSIFSVMIASCSYWWKFVVIECRINIIVCFLLPHRGLKAKRTSAYVYEELNTKHVSKRFCWIKAANIGLCDTIRRIQAITLQKGVQKKRPIACTKLYQTEEKRRTKKAERHLIKILTIC